MCVVISHGADSEGWGWDRRQRDPKGTPRDAHQSGEMNTREGPGGA